MDPPTVDPSTNEVVEVVQGADPTTTTSTNTPKKKKRKGRNFTFVIVPWSSAVVTNVIGLIKGLIDKFPPGSILRKLFNSKNVSYSYCVAKNMGHHIQAHNNKLLGRGGATLGACIERPCRESAKGACWEASGHCNAKNVVYGAKVTYSDPQNQNRKVDFKGKSKRTYAGCTIDLKRRVAEHRTSFNPSTRAFTFTNKNGTVVTRSTQQLNAAKRTKSTLAAHVWEVRDSGLSPVVEWSILLRSSVYQPGDHFCGICLGEVTHICFADPEESLNKRNELRQGCRHKAKFKLSNLNPP